MLQLLLSNHVFKYCVVIRMEWNTKKKISVHFIIIIFLFGNFSNVFVVFLIKREIFSGGKMWFNIEMTGIGGGEACEKISHTHTSITYSHRLFSSEKSHYRFACIGLVGGTRKHLFCCHRTFSINRKLC